MSTRPGFNLDELQSQILDAENYLHSSMEVRKSLRSSFTVDRGDSKGQSKADSLPGEQEIESEKLPQTIRNTWMSTVDINSTVQLHGRNETITLNDDNVSATNRYASQSDREALIERLLSEHQSRKVLREGVPSSTPPFVPVSTRPISDSEALNNTIPLNASIRFGSEEVVSTETHESPSLFRIMQSDRPVDVSGALFENHRHPTLAYDQRGEESPDSLDHSESYDKSLGATIKFTKSLDPHEKFIDLGHKSINNYLDHDNNSERSEDLTHHHSGSFSDFQQFDDSPIKEDKKIHRYAVSSADSLNSSQEFNEPNESHYRPVYTRVHPATQTPISQRRNVAVARGRSRSPVAKTIVRRNTREALVKQAEEEFKRVYTFTPQLRSGAKGPKIQGIEEKKDGEKPTYRPQRIQALHEEYLEKCRQRERMKYEFEKIDMMECTFRPTITRRSMSPSRRILEEFGDARAYENHASTRLHDEAAERMKRKHFLAEQIHQEEFVQYSFQPQIQSNNKYKVDERPIHERLAELQKDRQRYLNQLRESYEQERSLSFTFKPQIDERSRLMVEEKSIKDIADVVLDSGDQLTGVEDAYRILDREKDIGKRLMDESIRLKRRKQQLLYEREQELSQQMEPPKISKGSQKIIQENSEIQADFDTRMNQHQQRVRAAKDAILMEEDARYQQWFKPALEESTVKIIEKKRPEILQESLHQRVKRLSVEDQREIENHKQQLERAIYGSITYTPHIDPVSKLFGRKSSVQELYENPRGKQVHMWARVKADKSIEQECTFQPKINEKSRKLVEPDEYDQLYQKYHSDFPATEGYADPSTGNKSLATQNSSRLQRINFEEPERMVIEMRQRALEKEELRRQALIAKEIEELQECSFQPSFASRYRPETEEDDPIVIRGLGRHMELRDMAAKIKEENELRDYKAFHVVNVDKYRRPEDGTTIVQPFELSAGQKAEIRKRRIEMRRR